MKTFLKILLALVLIVVIFIIALPFFIGPLVTRSVNTMGPQITQSEVQLGDFDLNLLTGKGSMNKLYVGNPEGFDTESAIELEHIKIHLKPHTLLFGKALIIKEILINSPHITLEGITGKNLKKIVENAGNYGKSEEEIKEGKDEKKEDKGDKEEKKGRKVIIEHLSINDIKIKYNPALLGSKTINLTLANFEMKDIGKEKDQNFLDIFQDILGGVLGSVTDLVSSGVGLAGDGVKGIGKAAGGALKAIGNAVTGDSKKAEKSDKDKKE